MITWIATAFLVAGFIALAHIFKLVDKSKDTVSLAHKSVNIIRDPVLDDEAKEIALQKNSLHLFRLFLFLVAGGATAIIVPLGILWLCSLTDIISMEEILHTAISPVFIIVSSILIFIIILIFKKKTDTVNNYSPIDRLLHRFAFKTYFTHIPIADIENTIFSKELVKCKVDRPVFITALPRAGTTMLLNCCADLPDFAAHSYRDMPFVLTPCLWNSFSSKFKQSGELRERSHGDGVMISPDSHEALEEVLWKTFWKKHYKNNLITHWQENEEHDEFQEFFSDHMRKIIMLRCGNNSTARYVSKNNLNISRITWLQKNFSDSKIIIPFRDPLQHAASLLKQHLNFLDIHKQDHFAAEYMRAIGHFDFGKNLRPVNFDSWLDNCKETPESITFWLKYWTATYQHLLNTPHQNTFFIHYDKLCANPTEGLLALSEAIETENTEELLSSTATIHAIKPKTVDKSTIPEELLNKADDIYEKLINIAIN